MACPPPLPRVFHVENFGGKFRSSRVRDVDYSLGCALRTHGLEAGVSVFFLLLAAVFYTSGRNIGTDEFHIDTQRREIRHILRGNDGIARLQARYNFADLAEVQLDDGIILARDKAGRIVLNRPCYSVDLERSLASAVSLGLIHRA